MSEHDDDVVRELRGIREELRRAQTPRVVRAIRDPRWPGLVPLTARLIWEVVSWGFIILCFAYAIGHS